MPYRNVINFAKMVLLLSAVALMQLASAQANNQASIEGATTEDAKVNSAESVIANMPSTAKLAEQVADNSDSLPYDKSLEWTKAGLFEESQDIGSNSLFLLVSLSLILTLCIHYGGRVFARLHPNQSQAAIHSILLSWIKPIKGCPS
ncbi:hypothetical protein [Paraferrimonas haliotis]|uniref:Uncharacterized protein n=1 Tax=Paraferrimonas haliotis TaxID=2013866 RepID=A0AA37TQD2_9GAMM|nr:hypothetical protein [Paraferrimonas haliotis]GLS82696.1 hypothetical protein GCM10007894_06730 [Paraferrimonas haliotis]